MNKSNFKEKIPSNILNQTPQVLILIISCLILLNRIFLYIQDFNIKQKPKSGIFLLIEPKFSL